MLVILPEASRTSKWRMSLVRSWERRVEVQMSWQVSFEVNDPLGSNNELSKEDAPQSRAYKKLELVGFTHSESDLLHALIHSLGLRHSHQVGISVCADLNDRSRLAWFAKESYLSEIVSLTDNTDDFVGIGGWRNCESTNAVRCHSLNCLINRNILCDFKVNVQETTLRKWMEQRKFDQPKSN